MSGSAADFPGLYPILLTPLTGGDLTARSFAVNTSFEPYRRDAFRHRTIPAQRESIALTDVPGEGTVNTEGLWRRGAVSWHHGAGQLYADRGGSSNPDPFRFYESKGIDPWTQYQLGLQPDTQLQQTFSAGSWIQAISVANYVYVLEVTNPLAGGEAFTLKYYTVAGGYGSPTACVNDGGTMTKANGNTIWWIFTDGYNVYAAGDNGLWVAAPGGTFHQVINEGVGLGFCGTANGRVIMTSGPTVYDVTAAMGPNDGSAPNKLPTGTMSNLGSSSGPNNPTAVGGIPGQSWSHSNPQWIWNGICSGQSAIYMTGFAQNPNQLDNCQSAVYLFTEDSGTGALYPGSIALPLEQGEVAQGLLFYLNYVFVGTTRGNRMCNIAGANNPDSQSGCLIPGPQFPNALQPFSPIFNAYTGPGHAGNGFVAYDRFVWFGWPSYDSASIGLGRCDIGGLLGTADPPYASDLMYNNPSASIGQLFWCPITNGPGMVTSDGIVTRKIDGSGFPVPVASGTLNSGRLTFGIPDPKMLAQANFHTATNATILPGSEANYPIGGSISLASNADGAGFVTLTPLAPDTQANPPVLLSPLTSGEEWQIQVTLTAGEGTPMLWPFLTRWTVKALPQIVSGATISPVLMLYVDDEFGDQERYNDPYADYAWLENLRLGQIPCTYQEGGSLGGATQYTATVVITEIDWLPFKERDNPDSGYEGDLILYVKTIVG